MLVNNLSVEAVGVWETLRSSTLPHTHNTMLFWMQHSTLSTTQHQSILFSVFMFMYSIFNIKITSYIKRMKG